MRILVIGNEINLQECCQKFGERHQFLHAGSHSEAEEFFSPELIVFDFKIGVEPDLIKVYQRFSGIVFLNVSQNSLKQMISEGSTTFFGFCGLPTFLNRKILEISLTKEPDKTKLGETCSLLNTEFAIVNDQVGLVTPRVICMIINEAYFAIKENIASRGDIDLAMKLGTNYPFGPFEWCERIGVSNVYDLLRAVHKHTNEERYQVCDLLKEEAENFTQRR